MLSKPIDPDFDEFFGSVIPALKDFVMEQLRVAFHAGVEVGERRQQDAIRQAREILDGASKSKVPSQAALPMQGNKGERRMITADEARKMNRTYRGLADALRQALDHIGRGEVPVTAEAMLTHIHDQQGRKDVTMIQVRSSLKQLTATGEAQRLERGLYRAGPELATVFGGRTSVHPINRIPFHENELL